MHAYPTQQMTIADRYVSETLTVNPLGCCGGPLQVGRLAPGALVAPVVGVQLVGVVVESGFSPLTKQNIKVSMTCQI